ncbi:Disease resistance protein isoform G [Glycine soja]|uniref:Disease resistance protein isoform G n=1 Tax=Glycine soja TaxID=3848 RepID=A0A445GY05_GLYSO|nr:Disease resistance protein isoform G [Glycine soja]
MDVIANVPGVSEIANYVITFIKGQIGYISSYQENLQKLITEVQTLKDTQDGVQHRVVEAERNGDKIENIVQNWLKNANEIVAAANKVIDVEGDRWCLGQYCPYLWTRCQLSKSFEKMTKEISDVKEKGKFDSISYRDAPDVTITPFSRGYEALESRTSMLNEIKEILKDPKMYMIGVHGMGGVGKTTLVNELAWQVKKDGLFVAVAIANITNSPNVKRIQGQIADALLDRKLEKETEGGRATELRQRIKKQEKVLIILDDIWSELDLTEVGIPFGDEHNGCKLVITSREREVLIKMDTQKDFNLTALLEEDSWNLFQKIAGNVVNEVSIKPIAEEVAKCCAGLPLLITAVSKGLKKKEVHAWRVALKQLKEFKHKELENNVYPALKLSYDFLDTEELKSLFLFIGSFGLNEIRTEDLFRCCWGLGFYGGVDKLMEARDTHYTLINELRASSLLLEGELDWVRMHDVVRDVAKSIASKSPPTDPTYPTYADQFRKCHYITSESLTEVRDDNVFSGMGEAMTLSVYKMSFTPFLPPSLNILISLRSLNLNSCILGDIRIVAELSNLEILSLAGSSIAKLPEEIKHLTRLRLLNLTHCDSLRVIPTNLLSGLMCLEELYMSGCYNIEWEVEGRKSDSNNANVRELQNLHNLTTLEISFKDTSVLPMDFQFPANLKRYDILIGSWQLFYLWYVGGLERTLKLTGNWWTSRSLFNTVEELSFAELKGVKDLYDLDVEGFPRLKHLYIQDNYELLHLINPRRLVNPHSAFLNLETLVLDDLCKMEEICHGPMQTQSFAKLKVIKVTSCDGLKNLFLYSLTGNLPQLRQMQISNCRGMTEIIAMERQEDRKELQQIVLPELHSVTLQGLPELQSFYCSVTVDQGNPSSQSISLALFNQQVVTPKLETLELYGMKVCKIWDDKLSVHSCFQNLTHLRITRCNHLTSLFSCGVTRALVKLQHVMISSCERLKMLFAQEEVEFPNSEIVEISIMNDWESIRPNQVPPNSFHHKLVIYIDRCESMDFVFPISAAKELRQHQFLEIRSCGIKNIFEKSDMTHVYLEKIIVKECTGMKTIIPSCVLFQFLAELIVFSCHTLLNIIRPSTTTSLPKLRILRIRGCNELEEICGSSNEGDGAVLDEIAFMKLEELTLNNLPRLTSFCQGSYDFRFPSLQIVRLENCPMMETFCQGNITTPSLTKVEYGGYDYRDEDHWYGDLNTTVRTVFTKKYRDMEKLVIGDNRNLQSIWPNQVIPYSFPNLTQIDICSCKGQYVFPIHVAKVLRKLQVLKISSCTIENIVEESDSTCDMTVVYLEVRYCQYMMTIVPSSVQFHSLDELHVSRCHGLVNIIMPSTIANLPNLRILMISECDELEEVYGSNNESDEPLGEIAFMKLEELTLKYLPWLKSFCQGSYNFKFPSLQKVHLKDCPMMETFCHGNLTTTSHIEVRCLYVSSNEESEDHWDGDLNTTIRTIFTKKVHINQTSGS